MSDTKIDAGYNEGKIKSSTFQPASGQPTLNYGPDINRTNVENDNEEVKKVSINVKNTLKPSSDALNASTEKKMQGRRDRGRKKKTNTITSEASTIAATESVKGHHS